MTKEEREKQLQRSKWNLLYGLFICLIVWIIVSSVDVWLMRLDYADTNIKRDLLSWNFYNLLDNDYTETTTEEKTTTEEVEEYENK